MSLKRLGAQLAAALAMLGMSGCLSMTSYVDPNLKDVAAQERVQVVDKRPVQFIFAFQTNGATNSNATGQFSAKATEYVKASGLFSEISKTPVASGAVLSVTINNVAQDGAASQGFVTGLTLGLAASTVTDGYIATAKYSPAAGATPVSAERRHAIHTTIGAGSGPAGLTPAKSIDEAFDTVMRQLIDNLMNDVAKNPAFKPGPQVSERQPATAKG